MLLNPGISEYPTQNNIRHREREEKEKMQGETNILGTGADAPDGRVEFVAESIFGDANTIYNELEKAAAEGDTMPAEEVKIFGKVHRVARRVTHFGDTGMSYKYAGLRRKCRMWSETAMGPVVSRIRDAVCKRTKRQYNFVVVNYYPDGDSGIGWHADDEGDLDHTAPIASVSFGAERDMQFRRKDGDKAIKTVSLRPGSLLLMHPPLQKHWKHCIPKRKGVRTGRFNLTFRVMK